MILIIAGPSGSGKSTLAQGLCDGYMNCRHLPSYTTRPKRSSDAPGEQRCISEEEFERMKNAGEFAWTAGHYGNRYGTRKADFNAALEDEDHVYIAIIIVGTVPAIRALEPRTSNRLCFTYLYIDDVGELRRRLTKEERTNIEERMSSVEKENAEAKRLQMRVPLHFVDATLPRERVLERVTDIANLYLD